MADNKEQQAERQLLQLIEQKAAVVNEVILRTEDEQLRLEYMMILGEAYSVQQELQMMLK